MLLPVMESTRFEDHEVGEEDAIGAGLQEELAMQQGGGGAGGALRDKPVKVIPCPRCQSMNTKFCYYNNYSVTQPRHFCRNCQRYWTVGGTLRNVPVGGGSRKKTRTRSRSDPYHVPAYDNGGASGTAVPQSDSFLSGMQHLSMLPPPPLGFMNFPGPTSAPFLLDGLYNPRQKPLAGLQEVPDMQSLFDAPQVPQIAPVAPPMLLNNMHFFAPQATFQPQTEPLASVIGKAGLWSQTPVDSGWEMDQAQKKAQTLHDGGYGHLLSESLKQQPGFWPSGVADDRLVPHASWDDSNPSTTHNTPNLSPNGSSTTDSMANPGRSFYYEDVSQPWAGILNGF